MGELYIICNFLLRWGLFDAYVISPRRIILIIYHRKLLILIFIVFFLCVGNVIRLKSIYPK